MPNPTIAAVVTTSAAVARPPRGCLAGAPPGRRSPSRSAPSCADRLARPRADRFGRTNAVEATCSTSLTVDEPAPRRRRLRPRRGAAHRASPRSAGRVRAVERGARRWPGSDRARRHQGQGDGSVNHPRSRQGRPSPRRAVAPSPIKPYRRTARTVFGPARAAMTQARAPSGMPSSDAAEVEPTPRRREEPSR